MRYPNGSTTRPTVSSAFGPRYTGISGASTYHRGVDFIGFSTAKAIVSGKVVVAGTPSGWTGGGVQVWIVGEGILVRYCHLRSGSLRVRSGQTVSEGQDLGILGMTGTASGVHLHLEIRPGGLSYANTGQVDPVQYIQQRLSDSDTKAIQVFLNTLGLGLDEDGIDGPKTTSAKKWFQKHNGLVQDGIWGPATDAVAKEIKAGHKQVSRSTKQIQDELRKQGCFMDHWKSDGEWGNQCSMGTRMFQRKVKITVDSIYGAGTDGKLFPTTTQPPVKPETLDPVPPFEADSILVNKVVLSPNYNNGSKTYATKDKIVLHWFGTNSNLAGTDAHFMNPGTIKNGRGTNASSQYAIGADGTVHQYVPEKYYAHTNGDADANATSITIEHEGGPDKPITEDTIMVSAQLCADIAQRHGWEQLVWQENVFGHSDFVATQCPGTLDQAEILNRANLILKGGEGGEPTEPIPTDKVLVSREWLEGVRDYTEGVLE